MAFKKDKFDIVDKRDIEISGDLLQKTTDDKNMSRMGTQLGKAQQTSNNSSTPHHPNSRGTGNLPAQSTGVDRVMDTCCDRESSLVVSNVNSLNASVDDMTYDTMSNASSTENKSLSRRSSNCSAIMFDPSCMNGMCQPMQHHHSGDGSCMNSGSLSNASSACGDASLNNLAYHYGGSVGSSFPYTPHAYNTPYGMVGGGLTTGKGGSMFNPMMYNQQMQAGMYAGMEHPFMNQFYNPGNVPFYNFPGAGYWDPQTGMWIEQQQSHNTTERQTSLPNGPNMSRAQNAQNPGTLRSNSRAGPIINGHSFSPNKRRPGSGRTPEKGSNSLVRTLSNASVAERKRLEPLSTSKAPASASYQRPPLPRPPGGRKSNTTASKPKGSSSSAPTQHAAPYSDTTADLMSAMSETTADMTADMSAFKDFAKFVVDDRNNITGELDVFAPDNLLGASIASLKQLMPHTFDDVFAELKTVGQICIIQSKESEPIASGYESCARTSPPNDCTVAGVRTDDHIRKKDPSGRNNSHRESNLHSGCDVNVQSIGKDSEKDAKDTKKQQKKRKRTFIVVNTHLFYHPDAPHVRLLQVACLIRQVLRAKREYPRARVIFCGDLNSQMNTGAMDLLTKGFVSYSRWQVEWDRGLKFRWGKRFLPLPSSVIRFNEHMCSGECIMPQHVFLSKAAATIIKSAATVEHDDAKWHENREAVEVGRKSKESNTKESVKSNTQDSTASSEKASTVNVQGSVNWNPEFAADLSIAEFHSVGGIVGMVSKGDDRKVHELIERRERQRCEDINKEAADRCVKGNSETASSDLPCSSSIPVFTTTNTLVAADSAMNANSSARYNFQTAQNSQMWVSQQQSCQLSQSCASTTGDQKGVKGKGKKNKTSIVKTRREILDEEDLLDRHIKKAMEQEKQSNHTEVENIMPNMEEDIPVGASSEKSRRNVVPNEGEPGVSSSNENRSGGAVNERAGATSGLTSPSQGVEVKVMTDDDMVYYCQYFASTATSSSSSRQPAKTTMTVDELTQTVMMRPPTRSAMLRSVSNPNDNLAEMSKEQVEVSCAGATPGVTANNSGSSFNRSDGSSVLTSLSDSCGDTTTLRCDSRVASVGDEHVKMPSLKTLNANLDVSTSTDAALSTEHSCASGEDSATSSNRLSEQHGQPQETNSWFAKITAGWWTSTPIDEANVAQHAEKEAEKHPEEHAEKHGERRPEVTQDGLSVTARNSSALSGSCSLVIDEAQTIAEEGANAVVVSPPILNAWNDAKYADSPVNAENKSTDILTTSSIASLGNESATGKSRERKQESIALSKGVNASSGGVAAADVVEVPKVPVLAGDETEDHRIVASSAASGAARKDSTAVTTADAPAIRRSAEELDPKYQHWQQIRDYHDVHLRRSLEEKIHMWHDLRLRHCFPTAGWTNAVQGFVGFLDHILVSEDGFKIKNVLPIPDLASVTQAYGGLPNRIYPSDHLSVGVDLYIGDDDDNPAKSFPLPDTI